MQFKRGFLILIFAASLMNIGHGQTSDIEFGDNSLFVGVINSFTAGGSGPYELLSLYTDPTNGKYPVSNAVEGFIFIDGLCREYEFVSYNTSTFVLTVNDVHGIGEAPATGEGVIMSNAQGVPILFPPNSDGLSNNLQACIASKALLNSSLRGSGGGSGEPGASILNGTGAPTDQDPSLTPQEGEFYIDTDNNNIYGPYSTSLGWGQPTALIGPAGADGTSVQIVASFESETALRNAITPDASNLGKGYIAARDLCVVTETDPTPTYDFVNLGPIMGPKGDTGAQGPTGPQGPVGASGADGTAIVTKEAVNTADDLPTTGNTAGDLRITLDDLHGHVWDGTQWIDIGPIQGPQGKQGRCV